MTPTAVGSPELAVLPYEGADAEWDRWMVDAPGSTFCHLAGWRQVMEDVLGHRAVYLTARDGSGAWVGALPLVEVRSRMLGSYLLSMPFLNYGGPVGDESARALLAAEAATRARAAGVKLMELRSRSPVPGGLAASSRKVAVLLPLPGTTEELWKTTFKAKLRSQVRRPIRDGMTATFGADLVGPFYQVFTRNMRDLGTPVLSRSFFERIARVFAGTVEFCVVWKGDHPVAAGCGFVWGDEFEITWASSLREWSRSAPNMLLYSAFMERMIERGVRTFNFGRCTPGGGTHRFKLQWGGVDEPLPWAQWSPNGVTATPSPDTPLFRIATASWKRLPLPVANLLGPVLARRLP
jgi:serine/alanine adding enzyme